MLSRIAWRNIWRSRTRSLVVIGAIVLGIWSLVFMISFTVGMVESYVNNTIENTISHIQVHEEAFKEDQELEYYFDRQTIPMNDLSSIPEVQGLTARTIVTGMLQTTRGTRGIQIKGVNPTSEAAVTKLDEKIIEGDYFPEGKKNAIMISTRLAEKLKVKIRAKIVLTFQNLEGEITAGAFRVLGLYETSNAPFDENNVFVRQSDLNRLLGDENMTHELAFFLSDVQQIEEAKTAIQAKLPNLLVETYSEISPDVQLYESQIQTSATIFMTIIMLALLFGIINTMLMAVLERYKELGMLMSIGMNKGKIFGMIVLETIFLAGVALIPGLLLGRATVNYFSTKGIDLSAFSEGMSQFGFSQIVYPTLQDEIYLQLAVAVAITAVIGSLYPALKAIRLKPVEAIRKI